MTTSFPMGNDQRWAENFTSQKQKQKQNGPVYASNHMLPEQSGSP